MPLGAHGQRDSLPWYKRSGREDVEIFLLPGLEGNDSRRFVQTAAARVNLRAGTLCVVRDASEPTAVGSNWQFPLKPAGAL